MGHPFTTAAIQAMNARERLLRLLASQGMLACESATYAAVPWWWMVNPYMRPKRHLLPDLLGEPTRPWPPATCEGYTDLIEDIAEILGVTVEEDPDDTVLACLLYVNEHTDLPESD